MTRTAFCIAAALLLGAAPAQSQQPLGRALDAEPLACPAPAPEDGTPIEIRIAGRLVRAQVLDTGSDTDAARVQVRLVGCEAPGDVRAAGDADAADRDAAGGGSAAGSPLLRLLHDLAFGLELGPSADGRCIRARLDVRDHGAEAGGAPALAVGDEPKDFEICGFPFPIGGGEDRP